MKKKIFSLVLVIFILPCALLLSACEQTPALTKADYIKAFDSVSTSYNAYIAQPQTTAILPMRDSVNEEDLIDVDRESQMVRMITACVQFVGFLKNLCENQTFEIIEGFQEMAVVDTSAPGYVGNYKLRIKMAYDNESSAILSEVYCLNDSYKTYLTFEIFFDFATNTLNSFTLTGAMGTGELTANSVNYFKFQNNSLKMLNTSANSFATYAQSVLGDLAIVSAGEWGTNLPDYSQEYVDAMLGNA